MMARRAVAITCLALAACANRCSGSAFDATFTTAFEDADSGAKIVPPQRDLPVRVNASDRAEISFETWTHHTCTLTAKRDATGVLTPDGAPCTVNPEPPSALAVLQDASAARTTEAAVTITLRSGRVTPGLLELELSVQSGETTQLVHARGMP